MSQHTHLWCPTIRLALSLPDTTHRFELLSVFVCACGAEDAFTSWSRATGRHLTRTELREVLRQERTYGAGKARPTREKGNACSI